MLESASRGVRGGLVLGGLLRGVSAPGGSLLQGGLSARGGLVRGVSQHALRQTPHLDRHKPVKILPWPNFDAAGNNILSVLRHITVWYLIPVLRLIHGNGTGKEVDGVIGDNGSWSLFLSRTSVYISTWYYLFHLVPVQILISVVWRTDIPMRRGGMIGQILRCESPDCKRQTKAVIYQCKGRKISSAR